MIDLSHEKHVTTLVVNRPSKRNALNWATIRQLAEGIDAAEADPDCRCLLITGKGDHFVAGRDLDESSGDSTLEGVLANDEMYTGIFQALRTSSKPSVAVVRATPLPAGSRWRWGVILSWPIAAPNLGPWKCVEDSQQL